MFSAGSNGRGSRFATLSILAVLAFTLVAGAGLAKKEKPEDKLPEAYKVWLASVERLITKEERKVFLELEKDYQRDAFIERFWKARDPYPRTSRNEARDTFEARQRQALEVFGGANDERAQIFLLHGEPTARVVPRCADLYPTEVWFYSGRDFYGGDTLILFYQRFGLSAWRMWHPLDGVDDLAKDGRATIAEIYNECPDGEAVAAALQRLTTLGPNGVAASQAQLSRPAERPKGEWVASFTAYSTDLPDDAETFDAAVEIGYPGRYQSRTVVQVAVLADVGTLAPERLGNAEAYGLLVTGEILTGTELHDSFRVQFKFPADEVADQVAAAEAGADAKTGAGLPLVFERRVRPGTYRLVVRIEDLGSGRQFRDERDFEVPRLDESPPPPLDPETARILDEANRALKSGETTIQIPPLGGEWQTGLVRIDALITGTDIDKVTFLLDDEAVLTKRRPPFSVELDLGQVPRARTLRVEAFDADGEEIASDQVLLNGGRHRFAVQLVEPRRGKTYRSSLRAEAQAQAPEGVGIERVEFYLNETQVATVYQPPYIQPIVLPENEMVGYVRAVAFTSDGNSTEDLVFINAPDNVETLDINYVELYTTVLDGGKRPVEGLAAADFLVSEDGVPQEIARFEQVRNLPIHAAVMLDVSASMEKRLEAAQGAALTFFEQAITEKDRATVVTFNDHPNLAVTFTNDTTSLAGALAGLKAERGTALWDSLIFTLYYFNGVKGQRAVLLLSDGKDESSKFEWDDAIEYARRAGVTIYTIGLDLKKTELDARRKLNKLAGETGGRSFFIENPSALEAVYEEIQRELRSRYLITYQSTNTSGRKSFRTVDLRTTRGGLDVKTLRGYYP